MIEQTISLLAPHTCLSCSKEGLLLCYDCQMGLPANSTRLHAKSLSHLDAATLYEGLAKELVHRVKFSRSRAGIKAMAAVMARTATVVPGCVVTHAPTATTRVRVRGYDQAELLAKEFAKLRSLPYAPLLRRIGQQRQVGQTKLDRKAQLQTAFRPINVTLAQERHILLIDDVITTGSTLEAAARVLIQAGSHTISAAVFARA